MANEITITVVGTAAPALVEKEALRAFYDERQVVKPGVVMLKVEPGKPGQYYDFHVLSTLTVGAVGADGAIPSNTSWTHTQARVTLSTWQAVNIRVPDRSAFQSVFDYDKEFGIASGAALGEDMDKQVMLLYTSFTSPAPIGSVTTPSALDDSFVRGAISRLDNGKVPQKNRTFILHPTAWMQLLADADFKRADAIGKGAGVQVTGLVLPLYGISVVKTVQVQTNSGSAYANMLIQEQAVGAYLNHEIKIAKHDKLGDYSVAHLASYLGGFAVTRAAAGVVCYSATTT